MIGLPKAGLLKAGIIRDAQRADTGIMRRKADQ
jgi:hypothetical protein